MNENIKAVRVYRRNLTVVLGLILGHITEEGFGGALAISNGSPAIFFTRPLCIGLWVCIFLLLLPAIRAKKKAKKTVDSSSYRYEKLSLSLPGEFFDENFA